MIKGILFSPFCSFFHYTILKRELQGSFSFFIPSALKKSCKQSECKEEQRNAVGNFDH
jgi:hypothetical protein